METKEFREERFEFALYVNNFVICKRNFKINNFIEDSMQTLEFKEKVDEIVNMIHEDLKSKSRVATWYYADSDPDNEFNKELLAPWECTFKFVITDNKKEIISKIWDGYCYPKSVREKVDLTNKTVKIINKDGTVFSYDKDVYFTNNKDRLNPELYVLRSQIIDKPDLLLIITKKICELCSYKEDNNKNISDFTLSSTYKNKIYELDSEGNIKRNADGKNCFTKGKNKKYYYSINAANRKYIQDWANAVSSKTTKYFKNLF